MLFNKVLGENETCFLLKNRRNFLVNPTHFIRVNVIKISKRFELSLFNQTDPIQTKHNSKAHLLAPVLKYV